MFKFNDINLLYLGFFAVLSLCYGCGTVSGTKQIVSMDSAPRGAKVFAIEDNKEIGVTPFFYRMPRNHENKFKFEFLPPQTQISSKKTSITGPTTEAEFDCHFRWLLSGVGNLVFFPTSPLAYVAGLGVDLVTGAAFHCDRGVMAESPNPHPDQTSQSYCKQYILAPPEHFDEDFSDKMAIQWLSHANKELRGCDKFVDYGKGKAALEHINIDHSSADLIQKIGHEKLNEIAMKFSATHFIVLRHVVKDQDLQVIPTVIDFHTLQSDNSVPFKSFTFNNAAYRKTTTQRILRYSASLFPNSATFGNTTTKDRISANSGWVLEKKKNASRIPEFVSKFGLTSIAHSAGYSNWEFESSFYPSLSLESESNLLVLKNENSEQRISRNLFYIHATPIYNYGLAFHTPIGAFILNLGVGVSAIGTALTGHADVGTMSLTSMSGWMWRFFASENIFVQTGTFYYESGNRAVKIGPAKLGINRSGAFFQFGYYLPEMRRKFKSVTGLNY